MNMYFIGISKDIVESDVPDPPTYAISNGGLKAQDLRFISWCTIAISYFSDVREHQNITYLSSKVT